MRRSQALAFTFGFLWCLSASLSAAGPVEVDPATPSVNVINAPNGVPVVNIANPNSKGLSHNKFKRYNVESQGQILNNATAPVSTQLGGWINNNPNLSRSASVILNEVTGTERSLLQGYIEIAGPRADLIIANPNGISVNGGGFINTGRATLSTGQPLFNVDGLSGFDIRGGDILIEGQGLNADNIDSVALYAKAIQLNAAVYANELRITGGRGTIDLNGNLTGSTELGTGVSIDASALGAVYAGSITLIGTEKGVGVNLPPEVSARGNLRISASGRIAFQKTTAQTLVAKSEDADIRLSDRVHADSVELQAKTELALENGNAVLSANDTLILAANTLENLGEIYAGFDEEMQNKNSAATANLSFATLNNQGNLQAAGTLDIEADAVTNRSGATILADLAVALNSDALNNDGDITTADLLTLRGKSATEMALLDNAGTIEAKTIDAELTRINNTGILYGSDAMTLNVSNRIDNAIGAEITSDGNLGINKTQGAGSSTVIDNKGLISGQSLEIGADSISNSGALYSRSMLKVSANDLDNSSVILGDDEIELLIANRLDNSSAGEIHSGGDMLLAADASHAKTAYIDNRGLIQAAGNIDAYATRLDNTGTQPTVVTNVVSQSSSRSGSGNNYTTVTTTVTEDQVSGDPPQARILAGGNIHVDMDELNNSYGLIAAAGDVTLTGGTVTNTGTVLETTTTIVTRVYRDEEYCKRHILWWCASHGHRAVLKRVTTDETVERQAYSDTAIVAGGTLTTDVLTLSNNGDSSDEGLYRIGAQNLDSAPTAGNGSLSGTDLTPTLPSGSYGLFVVNSDPNHPYLIESNPLYTDKGIFFNSDYMLGQLDGFDAGNPYKKLGDDAYETYWVSDQITRLSQQRRLPEFGSDAEQFKGLMDNALALQQQLDLEVGISLSKEQIAALDRSIVWMETRVIDGHSVLVPVVYLASDLKRGGGPQLHGGQAVALNAGNIDNSGDIVSGGDITVETEQLANRGGRIQSAGDMAVEAMGDVINISGEIKAGGNLDIAANRLIAGRYSEEKTRRYSDDHSGGSETHTNLGVEARIEAGNDVDINTGNGVMVAGGSIAGQGDVNIDGGEGGIQLASVEKRRSYGFESKNGYSRGNSGEQVGSSVKGDNVNLKTEGDLTLQASKVEAEQRLDVEADKVTLESGQSYRNDQYHTSFDSGWFSHSTYDEQSGRTRQQGSSLQGDQVAIQTQKLELIASNIRANEAKITAEIMRLVSAKESSYKSTVSDDEGLITRTIESQGYSREQAISAKIETEAAITFNAEQLKEKLTPEVLIKAIDSQGTKLDHEQIEQIKAYVQSDEWHDKITTLSTTGQLLVQAVVAVVTQGMGTGLVDLGNAALNAAVDQAINGLIQNVATQAATVAITGDSSAFDLGSALKGAAQAGILRYADELSGQYLMAGMKEGLMRDLAQNATHATVKAGLDTAMYGGELGDNLTDGLKTAFVDTFSAKAAHEIGDAYGLEQINSFGHKLAHAALGCASGAVSGGGCKSGAVGAVVGEMTAELLDDTFYDGQARNDPKDKNRVLQGGKIGAILAAAAIDGDAETAAKTAGNAIENNYLSHQEWGIYLDMLKECGADKECRHNADLWAERLSLENEHDYLMCHKTGNCDWHKDRVKEAGYHEYYKQGSALVQAIQNQSYSRTSQNVAYYTRSTGGFGEPLQYEKFHQEHCGGLSNATCVRAFEATAKVRREGEAQAVMGAFGTGATVLGLAATGCGGIVGCGLLGAGGLMSADQFETGLDNRVGVDLGQGPEASNYVQALQELPGVDRETAETIQFWTGVGIGVADLAYIAKIAPNAFARMGKSGGAADSISPGSLDISDNVYVRFDPTDFDSSINDIGVQSRFFEDGKVWMTKYGDIKDIDNASDLETVLYRKSLWEDTAGKFDNGATLRVIDGVDDAVPAGVTNRTNGVRQWRTESDIPPENLTEILKLPAKKK